MKTKTLPFVGTILVLAGILLVSLISSANGASGTPSVDELRSSDAQIQKAIADLDAQVKSQQNEVAAANQAFDSAQQSVAQLKASLQAASDKLNSLKDQVRQRALEEYMQPRDDQMQTLLTSEEMTEASRRNELLRELSDQDRDALDEMHALKVDIDDQQKQADQAIKLAEKRKNDAQKKLDDLNAARATQAKAEQVLADRIKDAAGEDEGGFTLGPDDGKVSNSGVRWPIHGNHPVTSPFGMRWGKLHAGLDVGVPIGTPVFAAKEGTVTFVGPSSGYGNYVCVQSDNVMTCYGHLSRFETSVGAHVSQDTEIAKSGNTGHSTGAHLHFETCISGGKPACYYDRNYKNPVNYLP